MFHQDPVEAGIVQVVQERIEANRHRFGLQGQQDAPHALGEGRQDAKGHVGHPLACEPYSGPCRHQTQLSPGGVVPRLHAGGLLAERRISGARPEVHGAEQTRQVCGGDGAGTEDAGPGSREVQDGGLQPLGGGAAVQDEVRCVPEAGGHVGGAGGGQVLAAVGAGGGEGAAGGTDEGQGYGVGGAAQGHGGPAGTDAGRHERRGTQHQRQRAWPEAVSQGLGLGGPVGHQALGRFRTGHVEDHRTGAGPTLGGVDPRHGLGVEAVGTQAVDRLRGEGHQATGTQQSGGLLEDGIPQSLDADQTRHGAPRSAASTAARSL